MGYSAIYPEGAPHPYPCYHVAHLTYDVIGKEFPGIILEQRVENPVNCHDPTHIGHHLSS